MPVLLAAIVGVYCDFLSGTVTINVIIEESLPPICCIGSNTCGIPGVDPAFGTLEGKALPEVREVLGGWQIGASVVEYSETTATIVVLLKRVKRNRHILSMGANVAQSIRIPIDKISYRIGLAPESTVFPNICLQFAVIGCPGLTAASPESALDVTTQATFPKARI